MSDNKQTLTRRIGRYLRNLLLALTGNNPYQMELDEAREHLEKAADNLSATQDMCYSTMERWNESQQQVVQLQHVIETLRGHLREKDEMLEQMRQEYNRQTRKG